MIAGEATVKQSAVQSDRRTGDGRSGANPAEAGRSAGDRSESDRAGGDVDRSDKTGQDANGNATANSNGDATGNGTGTGNGQKIIQAFWFAVPEPREAVDATTGMPVFTIYPGDWFLGLEDNGSWFKVRDADGKEGLLRNTDGVQRG